ncbi:hypothetical protein ACFXPT_38015 [Streptomyces goshikiensis]|uniref:hypothetical protein n=1 Tax=Streptomyces goshikiensis TaxID=1942 RepID=UPI00368C8B8A
MVTLLNAKSWVTRRPETPRRAGADAPVLSVELAGGYTMADGSVITLPVSADDPMEMALETPISTQCLPPAKAPSVE